MLSASDPSGRYAEHKKQKAFYDAGDLLLSGNRASSRLWRAMLVCEEMKKLPLGAAQVETRVTSGQMSQHRGLLRHHGLAKNRVDRKQYAAASRLAS